MTSLAQHATGKVGAGDVEIFYRQFGRPGRTPTLIAHGLSYFSYDWIGPASALAVDREVIALDMRGFGNSGLSPSRDYKLETLSTDVTGVLDHLGYEKAVLIGHSFGGRICLATAGWSPARVAALILVDFAPDIAPEGRRHTAERIGLQPDIFVSVDDALAFHGHPNEPSNSLIRRRYEAFLKKTDAGYSLRRDLFFRDNFKRALDTGQSAPVPTFFWPMLSELAVPILVIRATEFDMFAQDTLNKVRASNPLITAIELRGGHDLASDNPEGLIIAIREFLERNHL